MSRGERQKIKDLERDIADQKREVRMSEELDSTQECREEYEKLQSLRDELERTREEAANHQPLFNEKGGLNGV